MFCVVGNSIATSPVLASRSSIFVPIFISCNGGVRSYSLSILPQIFRPATVVSEVFPPFYILLPPRFFRPATPDIIDMVMFGELTRMDKGGISTFSRAW